MSGFAKGGVAIVDGQNLAIAGVKPAGITVQGQQIWKAIIPPLPVVLLSSRTLTAPTVTSVPINTTGATIIVVVCLVYGTESQPFTDNQNNTWTRGVYTPGNVNVLLYYSLNPTTSTSHTFSWTPLAYASLLIAAFSYPVNLTIDQTNIASNAGTSPLQVAPITPSASQSLIFTAFEVGGNPGQAVTGVDGGFTITDFISGGGTAQTGALAYLAQGSIAALAPTWSWAVSSTAAGAVVANFIPYISPWHLLASVTATAPNTTTSPIDTTGATLLVLFLSGTSFDVGSDSEGNTWLIAANSLTNTSTANQTYIIYCNNPKTSTVHTVTQPSTAASIVFLAFKGPSAIFDKSTIVNSGSALATSITLPAITPSNSNALILSGIGMNSNFASVSGGFNIIAKSDYVPGVLYGGAAGYLFQGAAASVSPTWGISPTSAYTGVMASFVPSGWEFVGYVQSIGGAPSSPVDTTGVNLLIHIAISSLGLTSFTETGNNTWAYVGNTVPNSQVQMAYVVNPVTSTQHIFQGSDTYPASVILMFKCTGTPAFDQFSVTNSASSTTVAQVPITPTAPLSLFVVGMSQSQVAVQATSISDNFQIIINSAGIANVTYPYYVAFRIGGSPAAPVWTMPSAVLGHSIMGCFKFS